MTQDPVSLAAATWVHWSALRRWVKNPRKNAHAVPKIAAAIRKFGFVAPAVVWTEADRLVAGDTRVQAMAQICAEDPAFVPRGAPGPGLMRVVYHSFASEAEADAYALADNRLGELAEWDAAGVNDILASLDQRDRVVIGFDAPLVVPREKPVLNEDEVPPTPSAAETVTKTGDIWEMGTHRLICGDSTKPETFSTLLGASKASMLWTDPPYNVDYVGGAHELTPNQRKANGNLTIANDSMGDDFPAFLTSAFAAIDTVLEPGAAIYVTGPSGPDFRHFGNAAALMPWRYAQTLIWVKSTFVLGRQDYHYRHEHMMFGWKLGAPHRKLADRTQDSVWEFERPRRNGEHPTMKPVELIERALVNSSAEDAIVLDAFGGSGSTLIACEKTGRRARLVELAPTYCDVIVRRWEHLTGKLATRVSG